VHLSQIFDSLLLRIKYFFRLSFFYVSSIKQQCNPKSTGEIINIQYVLYLSIFWTESGNIQHSNLDFIKHSPTSSCGYIFAKHMKKTANRQWWSKFSSYLLDSCLY
jgi:ubiquinone biosynthesis protein Coq4